MSWAWSFYLRKWSLLYKHRRIMSSHLCSEWSLWSSSSIVSKMSITLVMFTVITFDSSDQSDYLEILITQWLSNHCLLCNHMQKSFNIKFSSKIFVLKTTFSSCLLIAQSKTLSCVAEIFLSVRVLSVLSCVSVNTAVACKRNVVSTTNSIIASSVCISIASAILLSWWWSKKE